MLGVYVRPDQLLSAAAKIREHGVREVSLLSPVPLTGETDRMTVSNKDLLKFFTFFGSVAGVIAGILFTIWTSVSYPLPRAGRPILNGPPTLIISFETLILAGIVATFGGFLILTKLPAFRKRPYHDRIGEDRFGIVVKVKEEMLTPIESILTASGAEEVIKIP